MLLTLLIILCWFAATLTIFVFLTAVVLIGELADHIRGQKLVKQAERYIRQRTP